MSKFIVVELFFLCDDKHNNFLSRIGLNVDYSENDVNDIGIVLEISNFGCIKQS